MTSHQLDSSLPLTNIISNIENGLTNGLQNGKRELIPSPQLPQSPQKKPRLVPEQTQIGLNQPTQPSLPKTPVSQTVSSNKNYADLITWFTSQVKFLKFCLSFSDVFVRKCPQRPDNNGWFRSMIWKAKIVPCEPKIEISQKSIVI